MKKKINLLIVDDRQAEIGMILDILADGFENLNSHFNVITNRNPENAISSLKNKTIEADIILVDIQMPEMTGFEFVDNCGYNRLLIPNPYIIIISALDDMEYRRMANDRRLEYLVKWLEVELRLVEKIKEYLNTWTITTINNNNSIIHKLSDINYIKADGSYSEIYFKNHKKEMITKSLSELITDELITSKGFIRIHDRYLVNKFQINGYSSEGRGRFSFINMENKTESLPIGRKYREDSDEIKKIIEFIKGRI